MSLAAEPAFFPGGSTGVVVQHGFTGSPKSMMPWAQMLADEGYSVSVPLLPGHGTTWKDANKTKWQDWFWQTEAAFLALRRQCEQVYAFGLSMGAALAVRLSEVYPDTVAGLVLVNPGFFTLRADRHLLPFLHHFVPAFPGLGNDIKRPDQDEGCYERIPLRAAHSAVQFGKLVMADIDRMRAPFEVYTSVDDHVVPPENSQWLMEHSPSSQKRQIMLRNSYHVATLDNDAPTIMRGSLRFLQRADDRVPVG